MYRLTVKVFNQNFKAKLQLWCQKRESQENKKLKRRKKWIAREGNLSRSISALRQQNIKILEMRQCAPVVGGLLLNRQRETGNRQPSKTTFMSIVQALIYKNVSMVGQPIPSTPLTG